RLLVLVRPAGVGLALGGLPVVQQQHVVTGKVLVGQVLGRGGGDLDLDAAALREEVLQRGGGLLPLVAGDVVAGDDKELDWLLLVGRAGRGGRRQAQRQQARGRQDRGGEQGASHGVAFSSGFGVGGRRMTDG